ncbi:MAG TPA: cbb3-type cytochrome c oxidase N-terminal domain-containing protein [Chitinophagaceae bacterium]
MRKLLNNRWNKRMAAFCVAAVATPLNVWAAATPGQSVLQNPLAITLLVVIGILLLAIALLAHVVIGAAQIKTERVKKERAAAAAKITTTVILCLVTSLVMGQGDTTSASAAVAVGDSTISGLSGSAFYALIAVIAIELVIIIWMTLFLRTLIAREKSAMFPAAKGYAAQPSSFSKWWQKINSFRSISEEKDIDLGHDYDNIRELDNKLPPWWLYGFYITIIFAGIYLWRYHVAHTAPLSLEELAISNQKAEEEIANNLKKSGNAIDENNVTLLTAAADIDAGKQIFTRTCAACHAADGGGIVGPNLTDEYWLHGGTVKDVFKTIKYGVPEKGMQSWKGSFSAKEIAQLASFIKSIKGSKVANPKEPQGDLFKEDQPGKPDSTRLAAAVQQQ